ncbi:MAG TPA: methylmalonyl-CoA mutase family protein, partial [Actinomycetota bacterium]|nr:methylmalonyl-CoA mutase family protein [Actinomycetota bacterium]
ATVDTLVIGPEAEAGQLESVARTRSRRDGAAAVGALARLRSAAADEHAELIGPLIDCARALCTEGEIVRTLRSVFGGYRETPRY